MTLSDFVSALAIAIMISKILKHGGEATIAVSTNQQLHRVMRNS